MTQLLAPHQKATHADARAIFAAVLARLQEAGWTRQAVDTFIRWDNCWQVRHHHSAGVWELHFERQPYWRLDGPTKGRSSVPVADTPRVAKIDRHRSLPSPAAILAQLFGPHHAVCTALPPHANGNTADAVKSVDA